MATLISLPAALASTGRSPTAKNASRRSVKTIAFDDRLRRQAGDGVVAVPAGEFVKEMRGVLPRDRQFNRDQQFIAPTTPSRKFP